MSRVREEVAGFALAWQFLTRVPLPAPVGYSPARMAHAQRYLPAVGLLIGAAGAAVLALAATLLPAAPAVLMSMIATAALTGAFHEDGLADTLDGFGGRDRARALEIMTDSRIGTFGAVGLGLVLALKATALVPMPTATAAAALVAGHAASRFSALVVVATSRYVRPAGTGAFTAQSLPAAGVAVAAAAALAGLGLLAAVTGAGAVLPALAGLAAGHVLARALFERRLGGYTGDCLGATQQLSEAGFYLGILAWL